MTDIIRIKRRALGGSAGAPSSLAVGELAFNEVDGTLWIGRSNGTIVQVNAGGGGLTISDTPPASPSNGAMWWESDTGKLFVYYNDGTSSQWVSLTGALSNVFVGSVVQSVSNSLATNTQIASVIPFDDTIPQNTEGTQILAAAITPLSTNNKLRIRGSLWGAASVIPIWSVISSLAGANAIAAGMWSYISGAWSNASFEVDYAPGSTSSLTISVRVGVGGSGTLALNGNTSQRYFGGVGQCTLTVEEIKG